MRDNDSPYLTNDELARRFANWLDSPFEIHPALLRLLVVRFLALAADAEHRSRGRPSRAWAVYFAVGAHLAKDVPPTTAQKLVAKEMNISVSAVKQNLRRVHRQMKFDLDGHPLDPDHPWYNPNYKPRWK